MSSLPKNNTPDYYVNLVNTRNIIHEEITRALAMVKEFIIQKNLILTGGMAIDLALKLKGDGIYTDDQIPDYDFYSPTHAADAYELGSILCKAGFPNITCINAIHITTMKVRVNFEVVADITYCPIDVYKQVPTLKYNNLRIVHPHWQMADQHSSLSIPFQYPGREVIFHRWKKDLTRYDLLYKHYPVVPILETRDIIIKNGTPIELDNNKKYTTEGGQIIYQRSAEREILAKTLELPMQTVRVLMEQLSGSCICGWAAVDYIIDGEYIILSIPTNENITVSSYDYTAFIEDHKLKVIDYYSEYFGKLPRKAVCMTDIMDTKGRIKKIEIYDIFGTLVSANQISKKHNLWVCNLQYVMIYLLVRIFSSIDSKIIFTAEEQYVRCRQLVMLGDYPSINVYGQYNFTHSELNAMKINKERIYGIKAKQLQPPKMFPKPPICTNDKTFDPETSEYFMTDARKMTSLIKWTLEPYPEYTNKSLRNAN